MDRQDLCFLSIDEAARLLQRKELSPVELTEAALAQIEALNGTLNAFLTVVAEQSLAGARAAEREIIAGRYRGALHGIPLSLKDLYYTTGTRTTAGSRILADFVPDYDAAVVERLRAAGAIVIGKNNMHEFAFGVDNLNIHYGPAVNPWDKACITGGSSGGSAAAVAAGMGIASLGSDTGGSIRIPAACCGVVGLKPTFGLISRHGVVPLSWSQDTLGPLTRTASDAARLLTVLASYDSRDAASVNPTPSNYHQGLDGDVRGLRVGVPRDFALVGLDSDVRRLVGAALDTLEGAGVSLVETTLPHVQEANVASTNILFAEAAAYHAKWFRSRPDDYGPDVRARIELGSLQMATDYIDSQRARRSICRAYQRVFEEIDALAIPTLPTLAPFRDQKKIEFDDRVEDSRTALTRFTRLFNLLGVPAIAVPCGFGSGGLPVSIQIIGRPFAEHTILRLARAYELRTTWQTQRPVGKIVS